MDELKWVQAWFERQRDGDWEHEFGIDIKTLDNPGWALDIALQDTPLDGLEFSSVVIERSATDWVHCQVRQGKFQGNGGPRNLGELIGIFRQWADGSTRVS
jgi:hypothetical protein